MFDRWVHEDDTMRDHTRIFFGSNGRRGMRRFRVFNLLQEFGFHFLQSARDCCGTIIIPVYTRYVEHLSGRVPIFFNQGFKICSRAQKTILYFLGTKWIKLLYKYYYLYSTYNIRLLFLSYKVCTKKYPWIIFRIISIIKRMIIFFVWFFVSTSQQVKF